MSTSLYHTLFNKIRNFAVRLLGDELRISTAVRVNSRTFGRVRRLVNRLQ